MADHNRTGTLNSSLGMQNIIIQPVRELDAYSEFIIKPEHIQQIWENPKPKEFIIEMLQTYFKSKKLLYMIEYNELNILAEYQLYNILFSKEKLALKDENTAFLLHILWRILEVEASATSENEDESDIAKNLQKKFLFIRDLLMEEAMNVNEARRFSQEEIKRIMEYVKDNIFKHIRLYEYVLSNKQLWDVKKISVFVDKPMIVGSLNETLSLGKERFDIEGDEDLLKIEEEKGKANQSPSESKDVQAILKKNPSGTQINPTSPSDGNEDNLESRLGKMNLDTKYKDLIKSKIEEFQKNMDETLEKRQKNFDEKFESIGAGAAKGKKK